MQAAVSVSSSCVKLGDEDGGILFSDLPTQNGEPATQVAADGVVAAAAALARKPRPRRMHQIMVCAVGGALRGHRRLLTVKETASC